MSENDWAPPADEGEDGKNFYAPPTADVGSGGMNAGSITAAERIRKEHISHEASVKSLGCLYILGGAGGIAGAVVILVAGAGAMGGGGGQGNQAMAAGFVFGFAAMYGVLGLVQFSVGSGLRKLQGWSRWGAVLVSVIGLIAERGPIGHALDYEWGYTIALHTMGCMITNDHQ